MEWQALEELKWELWQLKLTGCCSYAWLLVTVTTRSTGQVVSIRQPRQRSVDCPLLISLIYVSVRCQRSLGDPRAVRRTGRKGGSHGSIDTLIIALLSPWTWISTFTLTPNRSSRYKTLFLYFFSAPKRELSREIRKIALEGAKPDSYMRTLLTVLRVVDNYYSFDDPFLERYFKKEEYKEAKAKIKQLVMYNA